MTSHDDKNFGSPVEMANFLAAIQLANLDLTEDTYNKLIEIEAHLRTSTPSHVERITPAELEHLIEWHDACAKFSSQSDNFSGETHHEARAAALREVDELWCDIGARSAPSAMGSIEPVSRLIRAMGALLSHCDLDPEGETDFERAVKEARRALPGAMTWQLGAQPATLPTTKDIENAVWHALNFHSTENGTNRVNEELAKRIAPQVIEALSMIRRADVRDNSHDGVGGTWVLFVLIAVLVFLMANIRG